MIGLAPYDMTWYGAVYCCAVIVCGVVQYGLKIFLT